MTTSMKDYRLYWVWLAQRAGQGSKLAVKLLSLFGDAAGVYDAEPESIDSVKEGELTGREREAAKRILSDKSLEEAEDILGRASGMGMKVLVQTDRDFPRGLLNLRDAPLVLYVLGRLPRLERELCVSVVGTRTMSDSGRKNAFAFGYGLAAGGVTVVSGMALGVDGMALCGAITAGGCAIAVLGSGADVIYPRDHENLYNVILSSGAIISEYPPGTRPVGYHFPVRNRIISGLSSATVIVEADFSSGALITARHALFQGRAVFSVPGDVSSPGSGGTNELIKGGAIVATEAEDILREYEFIFPQNVNLRSFRSAMKKIDIDTESADAMARMRISARGGGNYYGKGSYGGKRSKAIKETSAKTKDVSVQQDEKRSKKTAATEAKTEDAKKKSAAKAESAPRSDVGAAPHIDVDLLDKTSIKVYDLMKPDIPVLADELVSDSISISDVLSSLSLLEIAGAVESGAGGYFMRRSYNDIELFTEDIE